MQILSSQLRLLRLSCGGMNGKHSFLRAKSIIGQQTQHFGLWNSEKDEPYARRMLRSLEHSKSDIQDFGKQMDTWIRNVNESEYLQQQLIADYYRQFAKVLGRRIKTFEANELSYSKQIQQKDLDGIIKICDVQIRFLNDSLAIRQSYFLMDNIKLDQFRVFYWNLKKIKYRTPFYFKLIHYFPIYLLMGIVFFSILRLIIITNAKKIHDFSQEFDTQLTQAKTIVDEILSESPQNNSQYSSNNTQQKKSSGPKI